ncbi:hypothetical protein IHE44_0010370 [Lamprotornis superbus]|uniref:SAM domain-containing protein n=1 Tax=Lamprotornis superbus TaxID=245042 RepID=A0A835NI68_9PASS|nr:hypothetical protein IHE44_0010370 [Lamprotornis superbus]
MLSSDEVSAGGGRGGRGGVPPQFRGPRGPPADPLRAQLLEEPPGAAAGWTCGQVGEWLQSLGLQRYVRDFSEHGVDGPRLLLLDGAKLKVRGRGAPGTPKNGGGEVRGAPGTQKMEGERFWVAQCGVPWGRKVLEGFGVPQRGVP